MLKCRIKKHAQQPCAALLQLLRAKKKSTNVEPECGLNISQQRAWALEAVERWLRMKRLHLLLQQPLNASLKQDRFASPRNTALPPVPTISPPLCP
jgi:hypothetical protein